MNSLWKSNGLKKNQASKQTNKQQQTNSSILWPGYTTLGHIPRGLYILLQRQLHIHIDWPSFPQWIGEESSENIIYM